MNFRQIAVVLALASSVDAFAPQAAFTRSTALNIASSEMTAETIMETVRYGEFSSSGTLLCTPYWNHEF
jgi:hypothetical protein